MSSSTESFDKPQTEGALAQNEKSVLALSDADKETLVADLAAKHGINHRKLMWKIDLCVVPPFCLLYFLAFLDRVNISNSKVYGLEADLGLVGNQFNTALTVFFVPYVFFEILSNYAMKFVKPHIWLSLCIFFFGIVTIGMGFVTNFGGLVGTRFLLGIFESGSFPALFYILANFYTKLESQRRFSSFFSTTCLAGGCAGALAYRIHDLDGVHGIAAWQWIFIIEGAMTAGLSVVLYLTIADFPEEARFLNDNERAFIREKLAIYAGDSGYDLKLTPKDIGSVFKDPMLFICGFAYFGLIIPSYGYAYFAPTIIKGLGYTAMEAQRHSIYPWIVAFGFSIISAFVSDRVALRLPFAIFSSLIAIVGLAIVMQGGSNMNLKYGGCFLTAMGCYSAMPAIVCWFSLNFAGHLRKSVGTAYVVGFGNIGGIISPWVFPNGDAPNYKMGLAVCIAFVAFSIVVDLAYFALVLYRNKQKATPEYRQKWEDDLTERQRLLKADFHPDFKYLY
ncbi:unnamed protein product [Kuraishia capsulata CBS 1993]|uniref:Major facilitator superfamily (MFS) profile domain-containing protein n=1 Tax=Kuraishia capsulata CBS 1993 TaxID=1382522 RepID=W6MH27_9ASCO|nr:uncharacterized protein KUCA_T00000910001 [Kuraishia capsulata CBS 1993]CDK24943.1 unnamed protein product [Kuraishia capsulata CBS 1993]